MLEGLAQAIDELDIPVDGAALVAVLSLRDRLDARISEVVGEYDTRALWDLDAATSMTAWLRHHAGRTPTAAARLVSMAKRLRTLPVTRAAWHTGTLTTGQVEIILANLDKQTIETFAAHETELVPLLQGASTEETILAMRRFAAAADAVTDRPEPADPDQTLHVSRTLNGRRVVTGDLDAETGELLETALRVFANHDEDDDENGSPARRRADALGDLCRYALTHHDQPVTKRNRPHVTLVYNTAAGTAETLFGERFTSYATKRLLCDAIVQPVYFDGATIVHVGEPTRTPSARLFNAIAARDRHCRFPGCDRPIAWCEAHHVIPWPDGPTSTDNLALFCSRHHHRIHQPGWHTKLLPDATLEITKPDGTTLVSHPPGHRRRRE